MKFQWLDDQKYLSVNAFDDKRCYIKSYENVLWVHYYSGDEFIHLNFFTVGN